MNSFSYRIARLAGVVVLLAGCAPESFDDATLDAPSLQPLDSGHLGANGMKPSIFQPRRLALESLLGMPLYVNGQPNPDPQFTNFLASADGQKVFSDAVGCALPPSMSAFGYPGLGMMATTLGWFNAPLTLQQKLDVQACMATRLNAYGVTIPIWVGGPDTGKGTTAAGFPYSEAVWNASINVLTGDVVYSVWPADTFALHTTCGSKVSAIADDLNTRICENNPKLCQIILRTDPGACTGQPGQGNWVCDGKPAIETRLGMREWNQIHLKCILNTP